MNGLAVYQPIHPCAFSESLYSCAVNFAWLPYSAWNMAVGGRSHPSPDSESREREWMCNVCNEVHLVALLDLKSSEGDAVVLIIAFYPNQRGIRAFPRLPKSTYVCVTDFAWLPYPALDLAVGIQRSTAFIILPT